MEHRDRVIVLDTHAWLWWVVAPSRMSDSAQDAIDRAESVGIPAICALEVATLHSRKRIELLRPLAEWVRLALAHPRIIELPITAEIAVAAGTLDRDRFPGDPADRLIYATACATAARLVSADRSIGEFDPARVVW
ncbi:MAG: PIN domain-containing protein [Solirubrobacterales bacterium]|nr:PIN domain-containing protein [Solirubrobacterales bacterium]